MSEIHGQLPLFELLAFSPSSPERRKLLVDSESEFILSAFIEFRRASGAAPATARSEASQLRSLCHAASATERPLPVLQVPMATGALVNVLSGLATETSVATNRLRLRALGQFVTFCSNQLGITFTRELDALYRELPRGPAPNWNHTGVEVGGTRAPRASMGKTLLAKDLVAVIAAGPTGSTYRDVRDRALLASACYTGLRFGELAALRWEQIASGRDITIIRLVRAGNPVNLRGYGLSITALTALAVRGRRHFGVSYRVGGGGLVFRREDQPEAGISERHVFAIVKRALSIAGFPHARQRDLRRAFLHWLGAQGLSDHEAMAVAGIRDARTLDALLERVRRLNAQRFIAELRDAADQEKPNGKERDHRR
jgi:integrase